MLAQSKLDDRDSCLRHERTRRDYGRSLMISRPAITITVTAFCALAFAAACPTTVRAASEVYIQQAHGQVAPGSAVTTKPTPETAAQTSQPPAAAAAPTAPDTCNAQNATSSQACYTATQQARPASR
jgi:hypothetical protein